MAVAVRPERRALPRLAEFPELSDFLAPFNLFMSDVTVKTMRAEEYVEDNHLVVRVEIPGVDPQKDIHIRLIDEMLCIDAERRTEVTEKQKSGYRSEMSYGSFTRTISMPMGTTEKDINATYKDGILEVRVPLPTEVKGRVEGKNIPIRRS